MKKLLLILLLLIGFSFVAKAAYQPPTGSSTPGQILWNNTVQPNSVGGLAVGSGLQITTTNGVSTVTVIGGGIPATAIIEETGTPILDETGNYIIME